ncbi:MAG: TRAP transporter large permease subunit, partial [Acetobacteraceae bacterium]
MPERSRSGEAVPTTMGRLFGAPPGGLGNPVAILGVLPAASIGIVGAMVATMRPVSPPAMMRAGDDRRRACGVIRAAGRLGQIVPRSSMPILTADTLQGARSAARLALGRFAPGTVSAGEPLVAQAQDAHVGHRADLVPGRLAAAMVDPRRPLPRRHA